MHTALHEVDKPAPNNNRRRNECEQGGWEHEGIAENTEHGDLSPIGQQGEQGSKRKRIQGGSDPVCRR